MAKSGITQGSGSARSASGFQPSKGVVDHSCRSTSSMISLLPRKIRIFPEQQCVTLSFLPLRCSDYLVKNKIAAAGKVAINGGSNGGKQPPQLA